MKDVRASSRLADSPSCIVVDEHDPTMQMQQILKMMGNKDLPEVSFYVSYLTPAVYPRDFCNCCG